MLNSLITIEDLLNAKEGEHYQFKEAKRRFDSDEAIAAPTATPEPDTFSRRVVVNSDNGLNLRAQPNAGGDVLYVLPYGMVLNVLSENENGFLYVQWGGYTGYVSAEYVTPFGD